MKRWFRVMTRPFVWSGAQLISLGVLGEYLGRVYEEVKARPLYIIAEEFGFEAVAEDASAKPAKSTGEPVRGARAAE